MNLKSTTRSSEKYTNDTIEIKYISNKKCCVSYSTDETESPPSRNVSFSRSSISYKESLDEPLPKSALKKTYPGESIGPSRSVSFNSVHIREHRVTLGDHPSSANGPPIQLDWEAKTESTIDLDEFEEDRKHSRRKRRHLKMSFREREELLTTSGFTVDQLKNAWMEALKIRQQRYETVMAGCITTKIEEAWESACRKFNRFFTLSTEEHGIEVKHIKDGQSFWSYVSSDADTPASSWFSLDCATDTTTTSSPAPGKSWSEMYFPRLIQL